MRVFNVARWMVLTLLLLAPAAWGAEGEVVETKSAEQTVLEGAKVGGDETKVAVDEDGEDAPPKEEPVTQEDIKGVRSEIETLRDQWRRTLDKNTAQTKRSLQIGGTVQTRYTYSEDPAINDGFSVNSIILSFQGSLRKDYEEGKNVNYQFSLSTNSDFTIRPLQASLSYSILPSLDLEKPYLTATVGQQKKPISLESLATEEFKPTIRGAQFASALKLDERDIGAVISGDLFPHVDYGYKYRVPLITYSLGVFNGAGPNKADDNNDKDVAGRVVLNAPVDYNDILRGLSLGGSFYIGRKNAEFKNGTNSVTRQGTKNRWGADLSYVNTPIGFTLEYVQGEDAAPNGTVANPALKVVRSEGYTFTLFYNFGEQFVSGFKSQDRYDDWYPLTYQPFIRFDRFDPDVKKAGDRTDIWTIGFNWFFAETTKLQLNYNIKTGETTSKQVNEFLTQFQFGF
ncbi:MAG: phosphate-selective porin O and [Geobacteraceae bacterium]|nr:MAG: phosphate-selective porin O and [Geobacteraceae bacterium]